MLSDLFHSGLEGVRGNLSIVKDVMADSHAT